MFCTCCGGALHVIGESVSEMLDWVPAQLRRNPHHSSQIRLSDLRNGGAGAGARAADRRRLGDACAACPGVGQQILRSHALVSAGANLRPPRNRSSTFDAGWMGRRGLLVARRATNVLRGTCSRRTICSPTTRSCRCSIQAEGAPRRDGCGSMPANKERGAGRSRRPPSICSRRTAKLNVRPRISSGQRRSSCRRLCRF